MPWRARASATRSRGQGSTGFSRPPGAYSGTTESPRSLPWRRSRARTTARSDASTIRDRQSVLEALRQRSDVHAYDSEANFILARFPGELLLSLRPALEQRGLFLKFFDEPAFENCVRITIGTSEDRPPPRCLERVPRDGTGGGGVGSKARPPSDERRAKRLSRIAFVARRPRSRSRSILPSYRPLAFLVVWPLRHARAPQPRDRLEPRPGSSRGILLLAVDPRGRPAGIPPPLPR